MTAQVAADLRAAADLLDREGWMQGRFWDEDSGGRCVAGALRERTDSVRWLAAIAALATQVGIPARPTSVYEWNDDPDRTAAEVITALRAAADRAEAQSCRCGHARDVHGLDRKRRPVCWGGSTVCACPRYREAASELEACIARHPANGAKP